MSGGQRLAPGTMRGEALRQGGAPGVSVTQRDDLSVSGVDARELDGSLIGFSAAVRDEALLDVTWSYLREFSRRACPSARPHPRQ